MILSTCNRVEVYGAVALLPRRVPGAEAACCARRAASRPRSWPIRLYAHWERDAADHLFDVAAGLDSMVLGETQIHAQVREALRRAPDGGRRRPVLTGVFHAASRAGRRVRQETSLGAAPDAFVALGTDLAEEALGDLAGRDVVVVGAGQMAALAVKHLHRRGVGPIRILNRSLEHARALADRTNAEHGDLDALPAALAHADLVRVGDRRGRPRGATPTSVAAAMAAARRPAARARRPRRAARRRPGLCRSCRASRCSTSRRSATGSPTHSPETAADIAQAASW